MKEGRLGGSLCSSNFNYLRYFGNIESSGSSGSKVENWYEVKE